MKGWNLPRNALSKIRLFGTWRSILKLPHYLCLDLTILMLSCYLCLDLTILKLSCYLCLDLTISVVLLPVPGSNHFKVILLPVPGFKLSQAPEKQKGIPYGSEWEWCRLFCVLLFIIPDSVLLSKPKRNGTHVEFNHHQCHCIANV